MPFADWAIPQTGWQPDGYTAGWQPDGQPGLQQPAGLFGGMNNGAQFGEMPQMKPSPRPESAQIGPYQQPQMQNWLQGMGLPQYQPPQQPQQRVDTFEQMFRNMGIPQFQQPQPAPRRGLFGGSRNRLMDMPYGTL